MGFITSIQGHDRVRKLAGLFAGLGHLQPLLLATTNSHYLLDRFCMERCCSGEYISRIVTSIIFMEILATLLVAPTGVYMALKDPKNPSTWLQLTYWSTNWQNAYGQDLNTYTENEERWRGIAGSIILTLIFLGYIQIFYAFTTGGRKKGHMHWFYASLLIQHFLNSLIAGSIGFWEVGLALWYLVTLPMAPIIVFFYQLYIHSWIRNNGPRYPEYLVVEWQIVLAISISALATTYWILGYFISYIPIELELNLQDLDSLDDSDRITKGNAQAITLALKSRQTVQSTQSDVNVGSDVQVESVTLTMYSLALLTADAGSNKKFVTTTLRAALNIVFKPGTVAGGNVQSVKVTSADKDPSKPIIIQYPGIKDAPNLTAKPGVTAATVNKYGSSTVEISLIAEEITVASSSTPEVTQVIITIPVKIDATPPVPIDFVQLILPVSTVTGSNNKLTIESPQYGSGTLSITVSAQEADGSDASVQTVSGKGFYPIKPGHCIYSVRDTDKDIWANIGGKCEFAACYKNTNNANNANNALLCLYLRTDDTLTMKYFGRENTGDWKEFTSGADFIKNLGDNIKTLATSGGSLTGLESKVTPQYNRDYHPTSWRSWTLAPLIMQGLSVGAIGSIFPNLIPKTLTCPKTSRTLSVMNMFMVTLPHIFNVMLGDIDPEHLLPSNMINTHSTYTHSFLGQVLYTTVGSEGVFSVEATMPGIYEIALSNTNWVTTVGVTLAVGTDDHSVLQSKHIANTSNRIKSLEENIDSIYSQFRYLWLHNHRQMNATKLAEKHLLMYAIGQFVIIFVCSVTSVWYVKRIVSNKRIL